MKMKSNYIYKDIKRAERVKKNRLNKRILNMLKNNNNCLFITFTFNNRVLKSTNQLTRFRYVKRYLNDMANEYILNIDYGKENKREHYHAIATPKYKIFLYNAYSKKYGYCHGETIGNLKRFANINKSIQDIANRLTEHSTKDTTKNSRIIYSRKQSINIDSKYKTEIDYQIFLNEEQKRLEEIEKEQAELLNIEIEHPTSFYYKYDSDLVYKLVEKIDNRHLKYKAVKYDIKHGIIEKEINYNDSSIIYHRFLHQRFNDLIVFNN